jgi:uncharacterized protein
MINDGDFMKKEQVLMILTNHHKSLKDLDVKSLELFGSVARNEAIEDSDVDFLVEFSNEAGFFELLNLKYFLENILGCKVDLGMKNCLRKEIKESVLKDAIYVFSELAITS